MNPTIADLAVLIALGSLVYGGVRLGRKMLARRRPITGKAFVVDGDSLRVNGAPIRMHGIDAPEMGQPLGHQAKQRLMQLCAGRRVVIEVIGRDGYGRVLGRVRLEDTGEDLNETMVREGLAFAYRQFTRRYVGAERVARRAKAGVHAGRRAERPWDYRRRMRRAA